MENDWDYVKKKKEREERLRRIAYRADGRRRALSQSQLRLCTKVPCALHLLRVNRTCACCTCVAIRPAAMAVVVVTVALVGEEIWEHDRSTRTHVGRRATRISKKGGTPFHPGPVNSSFRYSFLSSHFLRLPLLAPMPRVHASYFIRNGTMPKAGPKSFVERGLLQKERSDLPSRATFFSRYARRRGPLW